MYNILIYKNEEKYAYGEYDVNSKEDILNNYIIPYLSNEIFYIDGAEIIHDDVKQIIVSESDLPIANVVQHAKYVHTGSFYFATEEVVASDKDFVKIVTQQMFKDAKLLIKNIKKTTLNNVVIPINNKKVFVVYGHDENSELKVSQFISQLKLEPVILNEKANGGKTIIEKLEENSDVGFAVVLYTPDDIVMNVDSKQYKQPRPNVIFEYGYFIGKLGRDKVALLIKENIKEHSDIVGTGYIKIDEHEGWKLKVAKELKNAGFSIDLNQAI